MIEREAQVPADRAEDRGRDLQPAEGGHPARDRRDDLLRGRERETTSRPTRRNSPPRSCRSTRPTTRGTHKGLPPTPISNPGVGLDPGGRAPGARLLPVLRRRGRRLRRAGVLDHRSQVRSETSPPTKRPSAQNGGHLPACKHQLMRRLGVLGWPVAHSRSPAMHNAALADARAERLALPAAAGAARAASTRRCARWRGRASRAPTSRSPTRRPRSRSRTRRATRRADRRGEHAQLRRGRGDRAPRTPTRPGLLAALGIDVAGHARAGARRRRERARGGLGAARRRGGRGARVEPHEGARRACSLRSSAGGPWSARRRPICSSTARLWACSRRTLVR